MAECGVCIAGPLFFLIGLGSIYGGATRHLLLQKIKNIPTSKVRSAAIGLIEIFGKAKCSEPMESPISKAKCIYWRLKCEYYRRSGKNSHWSDFYNASSSNMFNLEDDTGMMLIDPKDGEIDIPSDFVSKGHLSGAGFLGMPQQALDKKVLDYLAANPDINQKFQSHRNTDLRVTESYIAEGDPLYVLGTAETKPDSNSKIAHENLIVKKGKNDNLLYISDSNEKKALDKIFWSEVFMFGLGFIFSAIGLILIISMFFAS
jgi:hypothetical protein